MSNINKIFQLIIIVLFITYHIKGEVRYISKTGGSIAPYISWQTACDSIQKCINFCNTGDTIYVDRGIYKEVLEVQNKDLTIIGVDSDECIIDGSNIIGTVYQYVMCYFNQSNIELQNLKFTFKRYNEYKYYYALLFNLGEGIVNNCIFDSTACCISFISGGKVNNSFLKNSESSIEINSYIGKVSTVTNSLFTFSDNSSVLHGISDNLGSGKFDISNNIMLMSPSSTYSNPIEIVTDSRVEIKNNLFYGFRSGVELYTTNLNQLDTNYVINNVFSNIAAYCIITGNLPKEYEIKNNIFSHSTKGIYTYSYKSKSDYNLFYDIQGALYTNMPKGEHDFIADPMFVNDTSAIFGGTYNYKLQKYSPAINAGDPGIFDIDGSRSDIGMYGGPLGIKYYYQDLPPKIVTGLIGVFEQNSNVVKLTWKKCDAADFKSYKIYKDINPNFTIDSTKLIAVTRNKYYYDSLSKGSLKVYYKVTAVDSTENESIPSNEINVTITDVSEVNITPNYNYELYQNYPNPFNPATTISYSLKEPGEVRIKLYTITGELIKTIIEGSKSKGYNETKIDLSNYSSGVYLYKLEVTGAGKIPVFNDLKKMVYLK